VTYPDRRVQDLLEHETVPVQVNFVDDRATRRRFHAIWTPTVVIVDADGEPRRTIVPASLPSDEFVPVVLAALGRAYVSMKRPDDALRCFDRVADEHAASLAAPEALYWRGVAQHGKKDDDAMKRSWGELWNEHAQSFWGRAVTFSNEKNENGE